MITALTTPQVTNYQYNPVRREAQQHAGFRTMSRLSSHGQRFGMDQTTAVEVLVAGVAIIFGLPALVKGIFMRRPHTPNNQKDNGTNN